jgi:hypothetical protein
MTSNTNLCGTFVVLFSNSLGQKERRQQKGCKDGVLYDGARGIFTTVAEFHDQYSTTVPEIHNIARE